jgi:hypothetical protein
VARIAAAGLVCIITVAAIAVVQPTTAPAYREAASDQFWNRFYVVAMAVERYNSLEDLAASSDAVLVGHISRVQAGRTFGSARSGFVHYSAVTIGVDRILAARTPVHSEIRLELMSMGDSPPEFQPSEIPAEPMLLFLRNKGIEAAMYGWPEETQRDEAPYFRRTVNQAVLRQLDGRVVVLPEAEDDYILSWDGRSFDELVGHVQEALR